MPNRRRQQTLGKKAWRFTVRPVHQLFVNNTICWGRGVPGDDAMLRVSVDVVALTVLDGRLSALVSRRARAAVPGPLGAAGRRPPRHRRGPRGGGPAGAPRARPGSDPAVRHRAAGDVRRPAARPTAPDGQRRLAGGAAGRGGRTPARTPRTAPGSRPTGCWRGVGWPSTTRRLLARRRRAGPGQAGVLQHRHRVPRARVHDRGAARGLRGGVGAPARRRQLPPQGDQDRGLRRADGPTAAPSAGAGPPSCSAPAPRSPCTRR